MDYFMDVVLVLDTSRAMTDIFDGVKKRVISFFPDLMLELSAFHKSISDVRIKVITFRNLNIDKEEALQISPYFNLKRSNIDNNEDYDTFVDYINSLNACGGNINHNSSLEALALAILNDWSQQGDKRMHYIVLFTNSGACKLEKSHIPTTYYPSYVPYSFEGLSKMWLSPKKTQWIDGKWTKIKLGQAAKRLMLFAPQLYPWPNIFESWDQVVYNPSKAGEGLDDVSYYDIINAIVGS